VCAGVRCTDVVHRLRVVENHYDGSLKATFIYNGLVNQDHEQ
jgi:hypothetical protein